MALKTYQLFAFLLVVLCTVHQIHCRHRDGKESRKAKSADLTVTSRIHNLCLSDRDSKLACHCTPDDPDTKAKKANCYIFTDNLTRKDVVWLSFHTQTSLEYLIFTVRRTGLLTYIPSDVIVTLKNLKELTMEYGQIESVEANAFGALSELTNISLPENNIKNVRENAFDNLVKLEEINLEKNNISDLDKRAFVNLPNLIRLRLGSNKISAIHDEMFAELEKLDELRIESNLLSVLTKEGFRGLGNLRMLKLSSNNINYLGESVFAELWSLQELHLDNNKIEKLSERAFDGLNNLRTLNLQNNKITQLEHGIFTSIPVLTSLNLNSNALTTLTYNTILPLYENLVNNSALLSIKENKFVCDCRLSWIFDLKNRTKNENLVYSLQQVECLLEKEVPVTNNAVDPAENLPMEEELDENGDYPYDEAYEGNSQTMELINLFKLTPETLPCPEELREPTEVPLQRESKGFGFDTLFSTHSSASAHFTNISSMLIFSIIIASIFSC